MSLASISSIVSPSVDFSALAKPFRAAEPFHHIVIDDFFTQEIAEGLAKEFPTFDSDIWAEYNNPIEI